MFGQAHSPRPQIEAGAEALRRFDADAVIAVGGGSAIVSARAAAIFLAEGNNLAAMATVPDAEGQLRSPRLKAPKLPQFIVATTPTTAMVKAGSAVFDPAQARRFALYDPKTRARAIFLDPDMLASAPMALVRSAAVDTLSLAIESLLSRNGDAIADAQLMHAVRLTVGGLRIMPKVDRPHVRQDLAMAAVLSGRGSDHTGAGVATVLGHATGAAFGLDNGIVKAVMLPHAIRLNVHYAIDGLAKVASALSLPDEAKPDAIANEVAELLFASGLPASLRELGLKRGDLRGIAEAGVKDWFLRDNPRVLSTAADLLDLLEMAY